MSQTLIEYRPDLFYPKRQGAYIAGKITFVPGVKAYATQDWEELLSHPKLGQTISGCVDEGILRVVSQSLPKSDAESSVPPLPKSQAEAIALIKKTFSLSLLTAWQVTETRKALLAAIAAQLKVDVTQVVVPPPSDKEGETETKEET